MEVRGIVATSVSPPICAWCIYPDGDMCTKPKSPVNMSSERRELLRIILNALATVFGDASSARHFKGECRPVCIGKVPCNVRESKRRHS